MAAVALGLGRTVVDGGQLPALLPALPAPAAAVLVGARTSLANSQRDVLRARPATATRPASRCASRATRLEVAEADGTLGRARPRPTRPRTTRIYDGISRPGVRLVSFAPVLKHGASRWPRSSSALLEIGRWGIGAPVEIEFAVEPRRSGPPAELRVPPDAPAGARRESRGARDRRRRPPTRLLCRSHQRARQRPHRRHPRPGRRRPRTASTARASPRDRAREVARFNAELARAGAPYLLIGVGRWGSADPWLGHPRHLGADRRRARDRRGRASATSRSTPSQGTPLLPEPHLVQRRLLHGQPRRRRGLRRLGLARGAARRRARPASCATCASTRPVVVKMNGQRGEGVILKP